MLISVKAMKGTKELKIWLRLEYHDWFVFGCSNTLTPMFFFFGFFILELGDINYLSLGTYFKELTLL